MIANGRPSSVRSAFYLNFLAHKLNINLFVVGSMCASFTYRNETYKYLLNGLCREHHTRNGNSDQQQTARSITLDHRRTILCWWETITRWNSNTQNFFQHFIVATQIGQTWILKYSFMFICSCEKWNRTFFSASILLHWILLFYPSLDTKCSNKLKIKYVFLLYIFLAQKNKFQTTPHHHTAHSCRCKSSTIWCVVEMRDSEWMLIFILVCSIRLQRRQIYTHVLMYAKNGFHPVGRFSFHLCTTTINPKIEKQHRTKRLKSRKINGNGSHERTKCNQTKDEFVKLLDVFACRLLVK